MDLKPNCPFYSRHMYRNNSLLTDPPFLLLQQSGNQCGLITSKHSPCILRDEPEGIDWRECPVLRDVMVGS